MGKKDELIKLLESALRKKRGRDLSKEKTLKIKIACDLELSQ